LRQGLTRYPRLGLNLSFCLSLSVLGFADATKTGFMC
jgi:hypothetical protein